MDHKVQDILDNKLKNLEIDDIDIDDYEQEERQSKILEQFELNQQGMMISQIKENKSQIKPNKQDNQMEVEDNIYRPELDLRLQNMMSSEVQRTYSRRESLRQSILRSQFSISEIQGELERLKLSEELKELLKTSIDLIQSIIDYTPNLTTQFEDNDKLIDLILNVQKTLFLSLIQIQEVAQILAVSDLKPQEARDLSQQYSALQNYCIYVQSKNDVNLPILQSTLKYLIENIFNEIEYHYKELLKIDIKSDDYIDHFNDIKIANSKLKTTIQVFPYATVFDQKDLFSLDPNDPIWIRLRKRTIFKQLAPKEQLKKSFKKIVKGILLANAMVAKGAEQNTQFEKHLYQNFGAIYYFFQSQKAQKKAHVFFSEPRTTTAIQVWNLMDQGFVKVAMSIMFPSIKYNKKIYLNPVAKRITLESIQKEYEDGTNNKIERISMKGGVRLEMKDEDQYYNDLFKKDESKIKIRILAPSQLFRPSVNERDNFDMDVEEEVQNQSGFQNFFEKVKGIFHRKKLYYDSIIIHIHGGGFVAMSSRCHQTYSRQWANNLNVPIFSIDYKKAPKHPYPEALDDCWQAYNWILNFVSRFFNIKPKKVVLVGDSAGGNLVTALTLRCIKSGVRVPDGIVIAYPALNLNLRYFTPSFLLALDDQILPHTFLKMCLDSYVPEQIGLRPESDPFISPIYASDELLRELPPTRILVGTNDPLHDECWRFLQKLENLNKDVKMVVYDQMPHGFLNYDAPSGMKEAKQCVQDAADFLKELLSYNQ
ncbi:hypothetical protein TTHERM_00185900 (macronuclear) [Tetrahymena thermophila SB210]|uniref:Alpha/beta hydrolase fold-3 domain-containing protein n=1 Tax=Tetrahymena thermophila (strain SB210) TaxID=312017 RepID=Q22T22_TETTS|nr:hypothetical protein TTHERM_00185900 [Tetrahymena thermophila SB210]EAR88616.3 hypothetical protein TTHERM_00185900 [Tetrahymena thermophila SB210]|eukprot:XP_001008861.3 hypothetical protein TTHERM_00185900 [Tetrahymena thermophila SB210]